MIGFSSNFHLSFLEFKFLFLNQHVPNQLSLPADDWRQQQCRRLRKERYYATTKTNTKDSNQNEAPKPKCDTCGKMHKSENCWDGANAANDPRKKKQREFIIPTDKISEHPVPNYLTRPFKQKTKIAAPAFWGKRRREDVHHRRRGVKRTS